MTIPTGAALITGASTGLGAVYADRLAKRARNADIVLFHDKKITAEAMPEILKGLQDRGFTCTTLTQLLQANLPAPGNLDLR